MGKTKTTQGRKEERKERKDGRGEGWKVEKNKEKEGKE